MTTYPLPTLGCTVNAAGISAPPYNDILLSLYATYQGIYGSDITFDPGDQDAQWLAIFAKAQNDSNQATIATYNSYSPATSQGAALSSVVKINGIARLVPSNSTAPVVIVGQAGKTITNGVIGDNQGKNTRWDLPATVNIPLSGTVTVTATCDTQGATAADPNTLREILTPTAGWQTVTNPFAAAQGAPIETDATLRRRQTFSTALPAQSPLAGILGNIANLPGVTGISADDNDTSFTDANGVPDHTLAVVVEGGDLQSIVDIIGRDKTIGCGTYGNTTGFYTDPMTGIIYTIEYSVAVQVPIAVQVTLKALPGYTDAVGDEIKASIVVWINQLGIGEKVYWTRIYPPALLSWRGYTPANSNDATTIGDVSIAIAIVGDPLLSTDIIIPFDSVATILLSNVTLVIV